MSVLETPAPDLVDALRAGNRRALARLITRIESSRADHRAQARAALDSLLAQTGRAVRLGISGVPGAGKSTFIERFGLSLTGQGHRVAVLAVDPSSQVTGGSILGDKTRMERLSVDPNAFIRPQPSGGSLGGVARRTREVMLACEAAGHDVVLVETVGVGQSETSVADMVDVFLVLLLPGAGDELQGIKRGIIERADLLVVNKADGDMTASANRAVADYRHALAMLRPREAGWRVPVLPVSALEGTGIDGVWRQILGFRELMTAGDHWAAKRRRQALSWLWSEIGDTLMERFKADPGVRAQLTTLERDVASGRLTPATAADRLLAAFLAPGSSA